MDDIIQNIRAEIGNIEIPALPNDDFLDAPVFDTVDGAGVFTADFSVEQVNYKELDSDEDSDDAYDEDDASIESDEEGERLSSELGTVTKLARRMIGSKKFDKYIVWTPRLTIDCLLLLTALASSLNSMQLPLCPSLLA
jgi:hypothetical protein